VSERVPFALTIAGSDSSGGAGIQADLKTFTALNVHSASVLTAVTAQNTRGVHAVHVVPPEMVSAQLDAVFGDLDIRVVKIGMLASDGVVEVVVEALRRYRPPFVVLDPVLAATSGSRLLSRAGLTILRRELLTHIDCLTPNIAEAAALLDRPEAVSEVEMAEQGRALIELGPKFVLMKGGHAPLFEAVDLLIAGDEVHRYGAARIASKNLHGTGCTLSAAIAAFVLRGEPLPQSVERAKGYLTAAISSARELQFGGGGGPVDHLLGRGAGAAPPIGYSSNGGKGV
jgi:hydroxymethylpyrimidine/phosphomethylpyrimidine kinase